MPSIRRIDLNCDLGEGFGVYRPAADAELIPLITSANIACGFHAGDASVMRETVRLCAMHHVAVGAHPGLPDLQGFGRRNMAITPQEAYDWTLYQLGALSAFTMAEGVRLHHVKPHGALYNMAAKDARLADAIAEAIVRFDRSLVLYGLAGSELIEAGRRKGLRTASEVFADRAYCSDGSLAPRTMAGAVLEREEDVVRQVMGMVMEGAVRSIEGATVPIQADTLCIHGDTPQAPQLAKRIGQELQKAGVLVQAP